MIQNGFNTPASFNPVVRTYVGLVFCITLLAVIGCTKAPPPPAPPAPPKVTVAHPIIKEIEETLLFTGQTRAIETVDLRARVRGFIASKNVEGGRRVKQGDVLFTIDAQPFEAQKKQAVAQVASADAQLRLAEVTLQQRTQTFERNAGTKLEVDQAQAERDNMQAQLDLAGAQLREAQLNLEYTKVVAPIDGRLRIDLPEVGELIDVGQLLATLVDDRKIYARYNISENTMLKLRSAALNRRPGEDGRPGLVVLMGVGDGTDYPFTGEYFRAENVVDTQTATVAIEAIFDNADSALVPGLSARIKAIVGLRQAMLLPDVAVMLDQAGRYVFIVNDKNIVERRNVEVGPVLHGQRRIDSGLTESDRVIVNGLQRARPASPVDPEMSKDAAPSTRPATRPATNATALSTTRN